MTIEWIENGEWKTDEPEPTLKFKVLKALLMLAVLMFYPTLLRRL